MFNDRNEKETKGIGEGIELSNQERIWALAEKDIKNIWEYCKQTSSNRGKKREKNTSEEQENVLKPSSAIKISQWN